jgi:hypothetical protein
MDRDIGPGIGGGALSFARDFARPRAVLEPRLAM